MKNLFKFLAVALIGLTLASCNDNDDNNAGGPELRVLTFEDADYKGTDNGGKGFADWSSLIDNPQYKGTLLYPEAEDEAWLYNWNDDNNTFLASELTNNYLDHKFSGGGHAVSNYTDMDLTHGDFNHQLAVYGTAGHNGSKNFCIHNGSAAESDTGSNLPSIYFKDGIERVVDHMWVANTTYALNIMKNGDDFGNMPFGSQDYLRIIAIGIDADGKETGRSSFDLATGTKFIVEWSRWDLASLGKVAKIAFNMEGSQTSEWGLNTPAYFAYDDVAVQF
ncbi:MAG: DUF4465 domain-containing protein [Alistipes sp.]|nr:DUF4465 domain-containing protein [Alistipes sp.]